MAEREDKRRAIAGAALAALFGFLTPMIAGVAIAGERVPVPVPKNTIYAGQIIRAELLRPRQVPKRYIERVNIFIDSADIVGKIARTTLVPSRPIRTNHVAEPDAIKVNRPSMMLYRSASLTISAEVIPLNNAKAGELVRARNMQNGSILSGIAQRNGTILAGPGR